MTECYIERSLQATNNYEIILTYLEKENPDPIKINSDRFQLDKMDEKWFVSNLEAQKDLIKSALA